MAGSAHLPIVKAMQEHLQTGDRGEWKPCFGSPTSAAPADKTAGAVFSHWAFRSRVLEGTQNWLAVWGKNWRRGLNPAACGHHRPVKWLPELVQELDLKASEIGRFYFMIPSKIPSTSWMSVDGYGHSTAIRRMSAFMTLCPLYSRSSLGKPFGVPISQAGRSPLFSLVADGRVRAWEPSRHFTVPQGC